MSDRVVVEESEETQTSANRVQWSGVDVIDEYVNRFPVSRLHLNKLDPVNSFARGCGRRVFGDVYGFTLFLAGLAFFASYWRIGFVITDSYAVANGLVAVSEGHLHVEQAVYGRLDISSMAEIDGQWYARNYGQIFMALPFLWLVQGVAAIADLRVALAGGWALLLLTLGLLIGRHADRAYRGWDSRSIGVYLGSGVAILGFVFVLRGATPIEATWHHLIALQLQTMVAAGLVGVVIYRLLVRMYDRRTGLVAGGIVLFASPITFWALFPKRHVMVSLGVFVSIYCLYRSRESIADSSAVGGRNRTFSVKEATIWRYAAYVPVGLLAWINSLEGFLLLVGLLVVDVPTRGTRIKEHVVAGCACVVSLVPFFVTNHLITNDPLVSPMTYRRYGDDGLAGQSRSGGASEVGGGGTSGGGGAEAVSNTPIDSFLGILSIATDFVDKGLSIVTTEFDTLSYVFLYSGYVDGLHSGGDALRLSYLAAMPVAAVLVVLPILLLRSDLREKVRGFVATRQLSPGGTVDVFVVGYAGLVILFYAPRMPMAAEITIRYLLVLFPLTAYGMMRVPAVRRVVYEQGNRCLSSYLAGVLIGGQLLFLYVYDHDLVVDEAFQIHSFLGLGLAALIGGWILIDAAGRRNDRLGAVVIGFGAATSTVFVLVIIIWFWTGIESIALPLL